MVVVVDADAAGFGAAERRLAAGEPIVIPTPSPLAYVLFSDVAQAVNEVKGRRSDQPVGVTPTSLAPIRPFLAVEDRAVALIGWLCFTDHTSVLAPVVEAVPAWLAPAVVDGQAAFAGAWLPVLAPLLGDRTHAYSSSANLTSGLPATTAPQADAAFGGRLLVIDGDRQRSPEVPHASTTMIRVGADGSLAVHRDGINNASFTGDHDAYLADLRDRFAGHDCDRR